MSPDELTGLSTRSEILNQLQQDLSLASQQHQPLAVLYTDCDHLLVVNNTYGHLAGDAFIKHVGDVLAEAARAGGSTGRIGGDEFLLILRDQPLEKALALAKAICADVKAQPLAVAHEGQTKDITVSAGVGVAFFPADGASITSEDLVRRAFDALLHGKQDGGDRVTLYDDIEAYDPLTHTLKRAGLLARFDDARQQADQQRSNVAIINLDIDEFDAINKQYGRYAGDEVLRRVARTLANNFKGAGHVGRYAGDEFVVVLPGSRAETAFVLAEEVRRAIEDTHVEVQVGEQKTRLSIRVSGGIAEYPSDGSDWESVFRRSDEALFRAKRLGRNRICLPVSSQMVTKTSHYTQTQLEKLAELAKETGKTEAHLLREALDDLLRKHKA